MECIVATTIEITTTIEIIISIVVVISIVVATMHVILRNTDVFFFYLDVEKSLVYSKLKIFPMYLNVPS